MPSGGEAPYGVDIILHEFGHAMAKANARTVYGKLKAAEGKLKKLEAAVEGKSIGKKKQKELEDAEKKVSELTDRYNRIMDQTDDSTETEREFAKLAGNMEPVSERAKENIGEAFAETYMHYKLYGASVVQKRAKLATWFKKQSYLK